MADYSPLIARAVAGLDKNTGENRRALYERARTALVAQLRGVVPALDESEITRERLALEEAIRKVEAEAARHARETARPTILKRADLARRDEAPRASPASSRPGLPGAEARPRPLGNRSFTPPGPGSPGIPPAGTLESSRSSPSGRRTLSDEAMRGFRHVGSDPNAVQSRRVEGFDHPLPPEQALPAAPSIPAPEANALQEYGQLEPQMQPENLWALPLDGSQQAAPTDFDHGAPPVVEQPPEEEEPQHLPRRDRQPRSYSGLIRVGLILILVLGLGALLYWQRGAIGGLASGIASLVRGPGTQAPREAAPAQPKMTDRVGQPAQQPSAGLAVAQRVVLYEEDPQDPQGKRYVGNVLWKTEMKAGGPGRPPELAVRGDIDVPDRNLTITWSLRRNTDQSLPASHTIEIVFNLPADSSSGGVQNVPGVLMKQAEQTRGTPLAGLAVKVTPGFFLIGLSALETDMQRNLQLLKERGWFDIPIVYNNNRRAILAMEKGTPGDKVFAEAFAAWRQ
jgi:hypothetical protein